MPTQQIQDVLAHLSIPEGCAIAFSGGGDSVALAMLMLEAGYKPAILHFNHNLRPEAAADAAFAKNFANRHNLPYHAHVWQHAEIPKNRLQQSARQARYAWLHKKCCEKGYQAVLTGHTATDVLETFFQRLSRGSGGEGLHVLPAQSTLGQLPIYRPLTSITRESLRAYLEQKDQTWREDPSNQDDTFTRVRWRGLLPEFQNLGVTEDTMRATQNSLGRINHFVDMHVEKAWAANLVAECPLFLCFKTDILLAEEEIGYRIINRTCAALMPGTHPPRTQEKADLIAALKRGDVRTLGHVKWEQQQGLLFASLEKAPEIKPQEILDDTLTTSAYSLNNLGPFVGQKVMSGYYLQKDMRMTFYKNLPLPQHIRHALPVVSNGTELTACAAVLSAFAPPQVPTFKIMGKTPLIPC